MTPEKITEERERFEDIAPRLGIKCTRPVDGVAYTFRPIPFANAAANDAWDVWKERAAIAHAEQAEMQAEIDRLRERVGELAKNELYTWLQASYPTAKMAWKNAPDRILGLAHEAGVWFDDHGNEVDLETWKGMVGT